MRSYASVGIILTRAGSIEKPTWHPGGPTPLPGASRSPLQKVAANRLAHKERDVLGDEDITS